MADTERLLWQCDISEHGSFRRILEGINTVLDVVQLHGHLGKDEGFNGISVGSTDPTMVCAVQAQYNAQCQKVHQGAFSSSFRIDLKQAIVVLRRIPDNAAAVYRTFESHTEVQYSLGGEKNAGSFSLPHIHSLSDSDIGLAGITTDHCVEVPVTGRDGIRDIITTARKLDAAETTFTIDKGALMISYENSSGIRGKERLGQLSEWTAEYSGKFNTTYLYRFCKGVDFPSVILGFKNCGALVLTYSFGMENTYLRFVLAPYAGEGNDAMDAC